MEKQRVLTSYFIAHTPYGIKEYRTLSDCLQHIIHRDHREGPAIVGYNSDDEIVLEFYFENNKKHHESGPAVIRYGPDDNIHQEYWLYGNLFSKDEFKILMTKKLMSII